MSSIPISLSAQISNWQMTWDDVWQQVNGLPESTLTCQPPHGGWSIQQVIQHLALSEQLSLAYLKKKTLDLQRIPRRDIWYPWRKLALKAYLRSPLRYKAPGLVTEDKFPSEESMTQTVERLKANQTDLKAMVGGLPTEVIRMMVYRHPIAGRMDLDGMFLFFIEHIRHHQRQIQRILDSLPKQGCRQDMRS